MKQWIWPDIEDKEASQKIARNGAAVSFLIATITIILVVLEKQGLTKLGFGYTAYIDAGLFFIVGIGIWFYSRFFAIMGLGLYGIEQYAAVKAGMGFTLVVFYFLLDFLNGVRGTFRYHHFRKLEKEEAKAGSPGPGSVLAGQPAHAQPGMAPPIPAKHFSGGLIFLIIVLVALIAGVASAWSWVKEKVRSLPQMQMSQPQGIEAGPVNLGTKTVRLNSGEEISGRILMEDSELVVIKHGGKEEVLERRNIASIE